MAFMTHKYQNVLLFHQNLGNKYTLGIDLSRRHRLKWQVYFSLGCLTITNIRITRFTFILTIKGIIDEQLCWFCLWMGILLALSSWKIKNQVFSTWNTKVWTLPSVHVKDSKHVCFQYLHIAASKCFMLWLRNNESSPYTHFKTDCKSLIEVDTWRLIKHLSLQRKQYNFNLLSLWTTSTHYCAHMLNTQQYLWLVRSASNCGVGAEQMLWQEVTNMVQM